MKTLMQVQVPKDLESFIAHAGFNEDGTPTFNGQALPPRSFDLGGSFPLQPQAENLAFALYENRYTNPPRLLARRSEFLEKRLRTDFVNALEAANQGTGSRAKGWTLVASQDGVVDLLSPEGKPGRARSQDFKDGILTGPKGSKELQSGWYYAISNEAMPSMAKHKNLRCYWSVCAQGAIPLLQAATKQLNEASIPFAMKFLQEPQAYTRCDAAVLYLPDDCWKPARRVLASIYHKMHRYLRPRQPLFTLQLAPGLGFAEDHQGQSFGLTMSRIAARGLWENRDRPRETQLHAVATGYADFGIDLAAPWRRPGSSNTYTLGGP